MKKVSIHHKNPKYLVWFRSKKPRPSTGPARQDFVIIHFSHMHLCIGAAEAGIPFCTSPCSNWLYARWPEGWDAPEVGGGAPDVGGALNEPTNIRKKKIKISQIIKTRVWTNYHEKFKCRIAVTILHEQQMIYGQIFLVSVTCCHLHTDQAENMCCGGSSKDNFTFYEEKKIILSVRYWILSPPSPIIFF